MERCQKTFAIWFNFTDIESTLSLHVYSSTKFVKQTLDELKGWSVTRRPYSRNPNLLKLNHGIFLERSFSGQSLASLVRELRKLSRFLNFNLTVLQTDHPATFVRTNGRFSRLIQQVEISAELPDEFIVGSSLREKQELFLLEEMSVDGHVTISQDDRDESGVKTFYNYVELVAEIAKMTALVSSVSAIVKSDAAELDDAEERS